MARSARGRTTPARGPAELTDAELRAAWDGPWDAAADQAVHPAVQDVEAAALRAVADATLARFTDVAMGLRPPE